MCKGLFLCGALLLYVVLPADSLAQKKGSAKKPAVVDSTKKNSPSVPKANVADEKTTKPLVTRSGVGTKDQTSIRPYIKLGFLVLPPDAGDLGFGQWPVPVSVSSFNYGAGVQVLFPMQMKLLGGFRTSGGIDVGVQYLFKYSLTYLQAGGYGVLTTWEGNEYTVNALPLINLSHNSLPLDVQAGAGVYIGFTSDEESNNGVKKSFTDTAVNFGFLLGAGYHLRPAEAMDMVLMLRFDNIVEYGLTTSMSAGVALTLNL